MKRLTLVLVFFVLTKLLFAHSPVQSGVVAALYSHPLVASSDFPELLPANTVAPDWQLTDTEGKVHKLSDYRGKALCILFWTPGCGHSLQSLPVYSNFVTDYGEAPIEFISISHARSQKKLTALLQQQPLSFPVLNGTKAVKKTYNSVAYPTIYIIDKDGKVMFAQIGNLTMRGQAVKEMLDTIK